MLRQRNEDPDGRLLATTGKTNALFIVDPVSSKIVQRVPLPPSGITEPPADVVSQNILEPDRGSQVSFTLIPVGWYPGAIAHDPARDALYVANIKGVGRWKDGKEYNTHQYYGTSSLVDLPDRNGLSRYTRQAKANYRYPLLKAAAARPRSNQLPRPVPERVGEPSVFKQVSRVVIVRTARTAGVSNSCIAKLRPGPHTLTTTDYHEKRILYLLGFVHCCRATFCRR